MDAVIASHSLQRPDGETVGDLAFATVRADILFGRLPPGNRLRLAAVSRRYGTSVSTMRETLGRLASEGLILAEGQRGFEVAPVSPAEFREIAALRLLLETHAMAQSFAAGDLEWEARVVSCHHKLAVTEGRMLADPDGDAALWKECDRAFHQALISACGSKVLMAAHAGIYDKYLRYQMLAVAFRGVPAAREHTQLLDRALSRDVTGATAILKRHIDDCVEHVLAARPEIWNPAGPSARRKTGPAPSLRGGRSPSQRR